MLPSIHMVFKSHKISSESNLMNQFNCDNYLEKVIGFLDDRAKSNQPVTFWWRDDDAIDATPELDKLLELSLQHEVPLSLAVIPKNATDALANKILQNSRIVVLLHGYSHRNHSTDVAKTRASEFGDNRAIGESLNDLEMGLSRLDELFGESALPILAPPWNRIGQKCATRISEVNLVGLSCFGKLRKLGESSHNLDVHWDPIKWGNKPKFCGKEKAWKKLANELVRRKQNNSPLGIMTHHLVHDEDTWVFLAELFEILSNHPGAVFPDIRELFGLTN